MDHSPGGAPVGGLRHPAPPRASAAPLALAAVFAAVAPWGCTTVRDARGEFQPPDAPPRVVTPSLAARRAIGARDVERYVEVLSSDELRGRRTPSLGLARAAAWVAERFQLAGLDPAGDDGGYVQYWPAGPDTARAPNVVGLLPGSELPRAGEYVLLVAHLDHLGVGAPDAHGDSIYNGADDNATGVAALVEIAEAFAALPSRPPRPIVFLAVSGREDGVRGTRWFVEHPTVDLSRAVAVLNLDMVGRNHPDTVAVVDDDGRDLSARLAAVASSEPGLGLRVVRSRDRDAGPAAPDDHLPFARAGVPAITISTGRHPDYHTPGDEAGRIDPGKAARVARLVFLTAHALSTPSDP